MIIETIITSIDEKEEINFAPIGIHLPDCRIELASTKQFWLRLYKGSQTYANLRNIGEGVVNFTEDSMAFVETALFSQTLASAPSRMVRPPRMLAARAIFEFSVQKFEDCSDSAQVKGEVLRYDKFGDYPGLCRAQGAVLEAAIMATRLKFIPQVRIRQSWPLWQEIVEKTGGKREQEALNRISDYLIQKGILTGDGGGRIPPSN